MQILFYFPNQMIPSRPDQHNLREVLQGSSKAAQQEDVLNLNFMHTPALKCPMTRESPSLKLNPLTSQGPEAFKEEIKV